jgi:hypothetical protein
MVRNLYSRKGLPFFPGLCYRKKTGDPSMTRTPNAMIAMTGTIRIDPESVSKRSKSLFPYI